MSSLSVSLPVVNGGCGAATSAVTYTEVISPSKIGARSIRWTPQHVGPVDGILEVHDRKEVRRYAVGELDPAFGIDGRAFRLVKAGGEELYHTFIANSQDAHCDCAGFTYRGACCHVEAMRAVLANGWLEDPRADPRADEWPADAERPF